MHVRFAPERFSGFALPVDPSVAQERELSCTLGVDDDVYLFYDAVARVRNCRGLPYVSDSASLQERRSAILAAQPDLLYRQYSMSERPLLYREFAETPSTEEGMVSFCQRNGFLFASNTTAHPPTHCLANRIEDEAAGAAASLWGDAEPLEMWYQWQAIVRNGVEWWDLLSGEQVTELTERIQQAPDGRWQFLIWKAHFRASRQGVYQDWQEVSLDRIGVAKRQQLSVFDLARAFLFYELGATSGPDFIYGLSVDYVSPEPVVHVVPENLLSAMWMKLLADVAGNAQYRQCRVCNKTFELHPEKARTNRLYCSDACRFRSYRQKQESAWRLHQEGMTNEQIAGRLETTSERVKGWIAKVRERASDSQEKERNE